jgi:hypothetical protein
MCWMNALKTRIEDVTWHHLLNMVDRFYWRKETVFFRFCRNKFLANWYNKTKDFDQLSGLILSDSRGQICFHHNQEIEFLFKRLNAYMKHIRVVKYAAVIILLFRCATQQYILNEWPPVWYYYVILKQFAEWLALEICILL